MSTSPRVAAKLLAITAAAAATVSIGLAAAAPAIAKPPKPVGPSVGSSVTTGTGNAAAIMRRPVSPFERFENAFDRFFHIPDPDDNARLAAPAN
jgi:hypothetical protein